MYLLKTFTERSGFPTSPLSNLCFPGQHSPVTSGLSSAQENQWTLINEDQSRPLYQLTEKGGDGRGFLAPPLLGNGMLRLEAAELNAWGKAVDREKTLSSRNEPR